MFVCLPIFGQFTQFCHSTALSFKLHWKILKAMIQKVQIEVNEYFITSPLIRQLSLSCITYSLIFSITFFYIAFQSLLVKGWKLIFKIKLNLKFAFFWNFFKFLKIQNFHPLASSLSLSLFSRKCSWPYRQWVIFDALRFLEKMTNY